VPLGVAPWFLAGLLDAVPDGGCRAGRDARDGAAQGAIACPAPATIRLLGGRRR
jgi:hypothetical protein